MKIHNNTDICFVLGILRFSSESQRVSIADELYTEELSSTVKMALTKREFVEALRQRFRIDCLVWSPHASPLISILDWNSYLKIWYCTVG